MDDVGFGLVVQKFRCADPTPPLPTQSVRNSLILSAAKSGVKKSWLAPQTSLSCQVVGALLSTLVMGAAYYLVITPAGLVVKILRDPLRRRWDARTATYWDELSVQAAAHEPAGPRRSSERPHWL